MKPYGFRAVGAFAYSWCTDFGPGKPHTVTCEGDAEISRRAGRRRPRRAERQQARREIEQQRRDGEATS